MTKHTPGPWTANLHHTQDYAGRVHGFIQAGSAVPLAAIVLGTEGVDQAEGRANAKLIAAAPELLEACELAQRWLANCIPVGTLAGPAPLPMLAAAIAKATS